MTSPARHPGLYFDTALLPSGWAQAVRIQHEEGRITLVERGVEPMSGDETAAIALPGVPNVHSHAFQRGIAGLTERRGDTTDSFWSWRELMYRFVARLTPDDLEAIAAQAYVEMLETGFTRVGEFHYVHHDEAGRTYSNPGEMAERIAAAAGQTGIALTLLPVLYAHGGFDGLPASPQQARFVTDLDGFAKLVDASRNAVAGLRDSIVGIAPHSLRAVTPLELRSVVPLAGDGPIHMHVAEQLREVEECKAVLGARPVEWLLRTMLVDRRWCLVHATHSTRREIAQMVRSRAVVGLCPITEANLGDGVFFATDFKAAGGAIGIGSDSNVLISASEELRCLEYGQRLRDHARNVMAPKPGHSTGRVLYESVLAGGAQALGMQAFGLAAGAPADIISLTNDTALAERENDALLDSWLFASSRSLIDCVWRGGQKVVSGGVHRERNAIAARFRGTLKRLLSF